MVICDFRAFEPDHPFFICSYAKWSSQQEQKFYVPSESQGQEQLLGKAWNCSRFESETTKRCQAWCSGAPSVWMLEVATEVARFTIAHAWMEHAKHQQISENSKCLGFDPEVQMRRKAGAYMMLGGCFLSLSLSLYTGHASRYAACW